MTHRGTKWGVRRSTAFLSIFLIAAFGLVGVQTAQAAPDEECVPSDGTPASFTDWEPSGDQITTEEDEPPAADTDTVRYIHVGETDPEVTLDPTTAQHYSWTGGNLETSNPPQEVPPSDNWQANTTQEPHDNGQGNPATWLDEVGSGLHYTAASDKHASWFYFYPGDVTEDTDHLWQQEVRDSVPAVEPVECDEPEVEGEEDEIPGKDSPNKPNPVQVAGEQAAVAPPAVAPPTSVNAGLGESVSAQSDRSPLGLLMVMLGALLTAAAAARRRARA